MKNKMTKTFLFFLLIISLASVAMAAPPSFETATFNDGLVVEFPIIEAVALNQTMQFHFHVYNKTNGLPMTHNEGVACYFHLYNQTNRHIAELRQNKTSAAHIFDYEFDVEGLNFSTAGTYAYTIQCNNSVAGGFDAVNLLIAESNIGITEARGLVLLAIMLGSVLVLLGCAFLFAYLYSNSDNLNKLLRLLYLGASMLCGIAALSIVESLTRSQQGGIDATVAGALGGAYSLVLWVFRIVMITWVIYLIYTSSMALLGKREDTYLKDGKG